jgi:hypothetical protein
LSDFLLNLRRSLAHKGFTKILDISTGMPAVFANPYASRSQHISSQHISSQKIAQLRYKKIYPFETLKTREKVTIWPFEKESEMITG